MRTKLTIEEMKELARQNNGQCLSEAYTGALQKLTWQCSEGHIWEARPNSIKNGSWCPTCYKIKSRHTIQMMQELATQRGGKCLSVAYHGTYGKLKWQCEFGHEWQIEPNSVSKGSWCPTCHNRNRSIDDMRSIAKERGGWCLSQEYNGYKQKLLWQCDEGHNWYASPNSIMNNGTWCPHCARAKRSSRDTATPQSDYVQEDEIRYGQ